MLQLPMLLVCDTEFWQRTCDCKFVESVCGCVMQESLDTVEAVVKKHRKIKWLQKTWVLVLVLVLVLDVRGGSGVSM